MNYSWKPELKIATILQYPWTTAIKKHDNGVSIEGVTLDMFNMLARMANFTYVIHADNDLVWGKHFGNGTWTGLAGMVQNKEIDILFPWSQGFFRQINIQPSRSVCVSPVRVVSSVGIADTGSFLRFLTTFDIEIWYSLLSLIFLTILVSACSDVLAGSRRILWVPVKAEIVHYAWVFVSAIFCEGTPKMPVSWRSRCLLGLWLLVILTMMNAFCGQFKAVVMVQHEEPRITSMQDLANRPHLCPILPRQTCIDDTFAKMENEDYARVWKTVLHFGDQALVHNSVMMQLSTYQRAKSGTGVVIYDEESIKSFLVNECKRLIGTRRLYLAETNLFPLQLNMAIRDDVPKNWIRMFNTRIQWLIEGNIISKLLHDVTWNFTNCEEIEEDQERGLKFDNLLPIFYLLLCLQSIAFLAFLGEVVHNKRNQ